MNDHPDPSGPDFEVWNWLESGWQQAYDHMADKLPIGRVEYFESMAAAIFDIRQSLLLDTGSVQVPEPLKSFLADIDPAEVARLTSSVAAEYPGLAQWMNYALELEIARRGIGRATEALGRFKSLSHEIVSQPVPEKARAYLRELVHTYLFGFDVAAVALARSTFEQFARAALVSAGVYTEPQIKREKPTAGTLLAKLKQNNLLSSAHGAATRLVARGDTILHSGVYDEKVLQTLALDSIRELKEVVHELAGHL